MGGGPSTPALAAAVGEAGGLGFLAAGYRTVDAVRGRHRGAARADARGRSGSTCSRRPPTRPTPAAVERFAAALRGEAERYGTPARRAAPRRRRLGGQARAAGRAARARSSRSRSAARRPVSSTRCTRADAAVWVTVTTPAEARAAAAAGADALVVQGVEAGGHRGGFDDAAPGEIGLLALLQLVSARRRPAAGRHRRHRHRPRGRGRARRSAPRPPSSAPRSCSARRRRPPRPTATRSRARGTRRSRARSPAAPPAASSTAG